MKPPGADGESRLCAEEEPNCKEGATAGRLGFLRSHRMYDLSVFTAPCCWGNTADCTGSAEELLRGPLALRRSRTRARRTAEGPKGEVKSVNIMFYRTLITLACNSINLLKTSLIRTSSSKVPPSALEFSVKTKRSYMCLGELFFFTQVIPLLSAIPISATMFVPWRTRQTLLSIKEVGLM